MARGKCFLIDNGADVQTFCHANVVRVFHHGNRLSHPHSFGGKAGENVCFRVFRCCNKGLGKGNIFFLQEIHIATICLEHSDLSFVNFFQENVCQFFYALGIGFKNLGSHCLRHVFYSMDSCRTAAEEHDVLDFLIPFLTRQLLDLLKVFGFCHKVDNIIGRNAGVPTGNECLCTVLQRHNVVGIIGFTKVLEGDVDNAGVFAHLYAE